MNEEIIRPLRYERVYLPLCKVADTAFHIQGDDIFVPPRMNLLCAGEQSQYSHELTVKIVPLTLCLLMTTIVV